MDNKNAIIELLDGIENEETLTYIYDLLFNLVMSLSQEESING